MMARMPGPETSVDTSRSQSVSFAPPHPMWPAPRTDRWAPVAVGPGRPTAGSASHGALGDGMTGYPIQPAKVQGPLLRDETLARHRLLDWLAAKIHHRVILVLADAGYGKTTLLADFSRRTRVRTLWYRLDDDDRDWISFLSHLVAAGPRARSGVRAEHGGPAQRPRDGRPDPRGRDRGLPARAAVDRRAWGDAHPRRLPPGRRVAGRPRDRPRARGRAHPSDCRSSSPADAVRPSRSRACGLPARSPSSGPTTSASTPPRPPASSPRPTAARSSRTSWPTWPPRPRDGPRRSSSSRPRCATGRQPRSANSSAG